MERQDIYKVFDVNNIFDYSDIDETDRVNMNSFFKSNYGFYFKDANSKLFSNILKVAVMATSKVTDIIIFVGRNVMANKDKYSSEVIYL